MSTDIYKEAIADAQRLKQMAEESAKNKIVEAVAPQIRDLIERQLMAEQDIELPTGDEMMLDVGGMEVEDDDAAVLRRRVRDAAQPLLRDVVAVQERVLRARLQPHLVQRVLRQVVDAGNLQVDLAAVRDLREARADGQ